MPTEIEIVQLIKKAVQFDMPQWKKDYMSRICNNLQVHSKGLLFTKVDTLFPNEHPESKNHCVNTYEPITKASIWKAINNITRIFSNSSFSVSASDGTIAFINSSNFCNQNLFSFFLQQWIDAAIATDPNSLCAVYPKRYTEIHGGEMVRFLSHKNIKEIGQDMVVFVSESESEKEYRVTDSVVKREVFYDEKIKNVNAKTLVERTYNQQVICSITNAVYHVFTKEYILRFAKIKDSKEYEYDVYFFDAPLDAIPAFKVSALNLQLDINESFVNSFIPFGNLALLQHRNHRAVDLMYSYPRMSEIQTPCDNLTCTDGHITDAEGKQTTCSRCKGSGYMTVQSPYKVYQKKIDTGLTDPEIVKNLLAADPVSFHTPDASILNYSKDSWKTYLSMAEESVFIQQKQLTGNTESAKAKQLDKEGEYSWIQNISKALNTDLKQVIQIIEAYENGTPAEVSLEQPISFALVTETEAFDALDTIISSEAPIFVKAQQVENFVHKFVSKSSPVVKALKILKLVDPLLFYSNKDVQTFKSNNAVTVSAWTTHIYAYSILMQLYEQDKLLFEKTDDVIVALITAAIEKLQPAAAPLKEAVKAATA
jgi:hypothetical protein